MTILLSRSSVALVFSAVLLASTGLSAHVSIWPRESSPGATEKYTLRVPSEGTVATTAVDLEVPAGVVIETFAVPAGWTYTVKKDGDRIASVNWKVNVKPGEFLELAFVARNPRGEQAQLVWILRQHFSDGTVSDWTKVPNGTVRPTAITKLIPVKAP